MEKRLGAYVNHLCCVDGAHLFRFYSIFIPVSQTENSEKGDTLLIERSPKICISTKIDANTRSAYKPQYYSNSFRRSIARIGRLQSWVMLLSV